MTTEKFYDLSFSRQPDGSVRLVQHDGGEDTTILAHPSQLVFIASRLAGQPEHSPGPEADLRRRIGVLADKLQDFACDRAFRSDLLHNPDGFLYLARLDALLDLALEYDGGRLVPDEAVGAD